MKPQFIFVVCQTGTETECKREITSHYPQLKFSFSKPGFITFKVPEDSIPDRFHLRSTFARTYGWSIGNLKSDNLCYQIEKINELVIDVPDFQHLHVWQRDTRIPGSSGFEPVCSLLANEAGAAIKNELQIPNRESLVLNRHAQADQCILDVIMVEPDYCFFGFHYSGTKPQRWPGGVPQFDMTTSVISRAYFKLKEALLWSGIHIRKGDLCAEIGSSPGGACQLLLEKEANVLAIDPADLDPAVADHENLTHHKCRGKEIKKTLLKNVNWLISDINVAPTYTLDTIEDILTNQHIKKVKGLVLTLKLSDLGLSQNLQTWIERIKKLGFQWVRTRQLAFNRREICLVAVRDRFTIRSSKKSNQ
ncbi:MAG: SAM-dependent methyltransferase [Planctomycetota bacterium]